MSLNNGQNGGTDTVPEDFGEVCVSVKKLWKVFGPSPETVMDEENALKSKNEIQEEFGSVIALKDVSFEVRRGETFVVMGLSGSGKSTLVRCLTRLIEPNAGSVFVDDEDIISFNNNKLTQFRRKKTAMVFQHFGLLPNRTIVDNVAFGLEIQGVDSTTRREKAREVLEVVGLRGWEDNYTTELSGGMQQRVGLARALAVNPEILLMDEPFSALDPLIRREMQDELLRLQAELKKTIIFITHDLDEALRIGDRIAIMRDGEIIQLGIPEEIIENPVDSYVEDFIRSISRTRVLGAASIMEDSEVVFHETQTTKEVLDSLSAHKEDYAFILDNNGKLSGVADKDDLQNLLDQGNNSIGTAINVDSPIFNVAYSDTPIDELVILSAMSDCPIAVTDGEDNLLGVVSRGELLHSIAESQQAQQGGVITTQ